MNVIMCNQNPSKEYTKEALDGIVDNHNINYAQFLEKKEQRIKERSIRIEQLQLEQIERHNKMKNTIAQNLS